MTVLTIISSNDLSGVVLGWMERDFGVEEAICINKIIFHCLTDDPIFSTDFKVKNIKLFSINDNFSTYS